MSQRIVVINPNSTVPVTEAISTAVDMFRAADVEIDCLTVKEGPSGIESQRDVDRVAPHVVELVARESNGADAFVIACYSDPGLFSAREATSVPVFGVAQAALGYATMLGTRLGVVSLKKASTARHMFYARGLNLDRTIVADRSADVTVLDLQKDDAIVHRLLDTARLLIDRDGADVIILGCCGMSRFRQTLERELGTSVVDPSQAAVGAALTALKCGYRTRTL